MSRNMRVLLELTAEGGRSVFVLPLHVRSISPAVNGARLEFCCGAPLDVRQRAETVASQIDQWLSAAYGGPPTGRGGAGALGGGAPNPPLFGVYDKREIGKGAVREERENSGV